MLAYLDPASGSMFLSVLVGGAAGIAVFGKTLWAKITTPFRKNAPAEFAEEDFDADESIVDADLEID
jgi:hypothetical protein